MGELELVGFGTIVVGVGVEVGGMVAVRRDVEKVVGVGVESIAVTRVLIVEGQSRIVDGEF